MNIDSALVVLEFRIFPWKIDNYADYRLTPVEIMLDNDCVNMELPLNIRGDQWLSVRPRHAPRGTAEEACLFDALVDRQWMYSNNTKNQGNSEKVEDDMPNVRDTLVPIWKSTPK